MDHSFRIFFQRSDENSILLIANSSTQQRVWHSKFDHPYSEDELKKSLMALELLNRHSPNELDLNIRDEAFKLHDLKSNDSTLLIAHIGYKLYQKLFVGQIGENFREIYTQVKNDRDARLNLYLQFDTGNPELLKYPWQLLRDSVTAPLLIYSNVNITYELSTNDPPSFAFSKRPISLMTVSPQPNDQTSLPNDAIAMSIDSDQAEDFFKIVRCSPQYDEFLQQIEAEKPEVVHFYGHGVFAKICPECKSIRNWWEDSCRKIDCGDDLSDVPETGYLIFETRDKESCYISRDKLHRALTGRHVKLFILSACQSAASYRGDDDVAGILIQCNIPAILAMQFSVDANQANLFNKQFYQRLIQELQQNSSLTLEAIGHAISSSRRFLEENESFRPVFITRAHQKTEYPIITNSNLLANVRNYKLNLANQIAQDAADQKTSLDLRDYIANYIPLNVTHDWGELALDKNQTHENALEKLRNSRGKFILLQGSNGSGKSALAKHLAYIIAKEETRTLPVFIDLRYDTSRSLIEQVRWQLTHYNQSWSQNESENLVNLLTEGRLHCYFIFDGLNKVSSNFIREIKEFWDTYHTHTVVIMSRPRRDLISQLSHADQIERLKLQPLTTSQIRKQMTSHTLQIKMIESAENPMLLSFLLNGGVDQAEVNNHGQIFRDYVYRVIETEKTNNVRNNIEPEVKWEVLKQLAYALTYRNEQKIAYTQAVEIISLYLTCSRKEEKNDEIDPEDILEALTFHGFLQEKEKRISSEEDKGNLYFTSGLWMQEYFAAEKLTSIVKDKNQHPSFFPWKTWLMCLIHPQLLEAVPPEKRWRLIVFYNSRLAILAHDSRWTETFTIVADLLLEDIESRKWLLDKLTLSWARPGLAFLCTQNADSPNNEVGVFSEQLNSSDEDARYEAIKDIVDAVYVTSLSLSDKKFEFLVEVIGDESLRISNYVMSRLMPLISDKIKTDIENLGAGKSEKFQRGKERILQASQEELPPIIEPSTAWVGKFILFIFRRLHDIGSLLQQVSTSPLNLILISLLVGLIVDFLRFPFQPNQIRRNPQGIIIGLIVGVVLYFIAKGIRGYWIKQKHRFIDYV